jgi:phenylpropionate dioxygenase-like ring-hydroxylating dioxygenase large terminal subunit
MLKNFWYACEFSRAITSKPKRIALLNQEFVLYRNLLGEVVALNDRCPHRGATLSLGKVEGNCIRCPYHGWKFQSDGTCVEIPANQIGVPIPKKARVDSYPVREKYGLVWLFWGDIPLEESPPIPSISTFESPKFYAFSFAKYLPVNYTRLLEIQLDFAHVPFVHHRSFGSGIAKAPKIPEYQVDRQDWGASASYQIKQTKPKGFLWKHFQGQSQPKVTLGFHLPNNFQVEIDLGWGKLAMFCAYTPVDNNTTIARLIYLRNFCKHPWMNGLFQIVENKLAKEDLRVVKTVRPQVVPYELTEEIFVPSDALLIAYRQLRQKYQQMGWAIDSCDRVSEKDCGKLGSSNK